MIRQRWIDDQSNTFTRDDKVAMILELWWKRVNAMKVKI